MALRLVLVGVVASLGLTLPSREALDAWTRSGQAWMNARLAEWESRRPVDENAFVYVADAVEPTNPVRVASNAADSNDLTLKPLVDEWVECMKQAPDLGKVARVGCEASDWLSFAGLEVFDSASPLGESKVTDATPQPTRKEVISDWEFQLLVAESSMGYDVPATDAPAKVVTERVGQKLDWSAALGKASSALARVRAQVIIVGEALEAAQKRIDADNWDREFELAMDEVVATFSPIPQPALKVAEIEDPECSFDRVVDEMIATFSKDLETAEAAARIAAADRAALLESLELDEAYELVQVQTASRALLGEGGVASDRRPEAQVMAKAAAEPPVDPNRLANAVRLTREAVNAWASLLHGPAVVTISR